MKTLVHCLAGILLIVRPGFCQEETQTVDEKTGWRTFCDLTAANITIRQPRSGLSKEKVFARHENAIFEHKNPFNQTEHGLVYLWKQDNGRPVAIFTCLLNQSRQNTWGEIIEYHSLHDAPLVASFGAPNDDDSEVYCRAHQWKPKQGIEWNVLPNSPAPPSNSRLVKLQGQKLVRRFQCLGVFGTQEYNLRALAKPVYTFDTKENGKQLGGLLTFFCRATDPEALLLLELREDAKGKLAWHYALGNFTRGLIKFSLDKNEIWTNNSNGRYWIQPADVHYGSFPYRHRGTFTIEDGIARQQAHLDRTKKK